jgi:hypothetical protein
MKVRRFVARTAVAAAAVGGLSLLGAAPAFAYGPTGNTAATSSATVSPGGTVLFEGHLDCFNCSVSVYINGYNGAIATTTTNAAGDFSVSVTIPSGLSGYHTLTAVASNGASASTTIDIVVPATSTTSALATTGADVAGAIGVAAVAIGAGGGLVLLSRKRRPQQF